MLGGLGFKNLRCQNKAYIMKLCWTMLTQKDKLWVKVLRAKYKVDDAKIPFVVKTQNPSVTWNSITKVWEEFLDRIGWKLGNGRDTSFWFDKWSPIDQPLVCHGTNPEKVLHLRTADFVTRGGVWDILKLQRYLSNDLIDQIIRVSPHKPDSGEDVICWRPAFDGNFSVKTAYKSLSKDHRNTSHPCWKKIWRWNTHEKIKFFLWKLGRNRIPTNSVCGYSEDTGRSCPFGCNVPETPTHAIRDCSFSRQVWTKLIKPSVLANFFSLSSLQDWIVWNADNEASSYRRNGVPWKKMFAHTCWWIWKERCSRIFSNLSRGVDDLIFLCHRSALEDSVLEEQRGRIEDYLAVQQDTWRPPQPGWVRVDIDGSLNGMGKQRVEASLEIIGGIL